MGTIFLLMVFGTLFVESEGGHRCSKPNTCCKDDEVCCSDGCCKLPYSVCCPGNSCCRKDYPVCCPGYCCQSGYQCCSGQCCAGKFAEKSYGIKSQNISLSSVSSYWTSSKGKMKQDKMSWNLVNKVKQAINAPNDQKDLNGPCNSYAVEKVNEGYSHHVYPDSKGIPTIGVGFNLKKPGARKQIEGVGANYDAVLSGTQNLTDSQINTLFNEDMSTALACGPQLFHKWISLGVGPQSALADMIFNMGCDKLNQFVCLGVALNRNPIDYQWASKEMSSSAWCQQVHQTRCGRDVQCMLTAWLN